MIVLIVNGYPRSGKDTFVETTKSLYIGYGYSTIDTVKRMAVAFGWDGIKTEQTRRMLSDLKKLWVEHFDGPFTEFKEKVSLVREAGGFQLFMVQTREDKEVVRFKEWCCENNIQSYYVMINRGGTGDFGNDSDDNIFKEIKPDIIVKNDGSLQTFNNEIRKILGKVVK